MFQVENELGLKIKDLENNLSKSEGTARYIEYCVKKTLKIEPNNLVLSKIDSKYKVNRFKDYNLNQEKWMYNVGESYYYAIGFNLIRVLEKLKINYQKDIFSKNKSFDFYLNEYLK